MIKDTPKVIDDVGQEFEREPTEVEKEMVDTQDVVRYMERTYPEMTSEFKKYNQNNMNYFVENNMIMAHKI